MLEILYSKEKEMLDGELLRRIAKDVSEGKKVTLIVPEQQVYGTETMLSYNGIMSPELEVVGFRRLCESIFRRFGGLAYNDISDGARLVLMWRTLAELSPMLKEYNNVELDDMDMIKSLLASVSELSLYAVTPKQLEDVAKKIKGTSERLYRKLNDLALISAASSALLKNEYNDPAEDTRRAAEILENNDYFGDRCVYIAHFISFTVYEKKVIENIICKAEKTTALIGMDKGDTRVIFDTLRETKDVFLTAAAKNSVSVKQTALEGENCDTAPEIRYFSENIWRTESEKYDGECKNIRIASARDAREEARFVASDIARRVREIGARYRDFAVILRNTADYEGIIDEALEDANIPYFISSKTDIKKKAPIKMILQALKIKAHSWRTEDVIAYMRCGYTSLSHDALDRLEQYASLWKISGKRWYDSYEWAMHPRGFGEMMTEEDEKLLAELNCYRSEVVSPLVKFLDSFGADATLEKISVSLYRFLESISLRERLEKDAALLRDRGEVSEADETVQIWNFLIDSLDSLVKVAGDMKCNASAYAKLLSASLETSSIGTIPSGIDEVVVGEAQSLRNTGAKYVYVIGLCEGVFPAVASEDSVLGDVDRRLLDKEGITLSRVSTESVKDEMFCFYLAVCAAKKDLTLTYNKQKNVSSFVYSIKSMFEDVCEINVSELPKDYFVWSDMSALKYALGLSESESELSHEIKEYLKERGNIGFFAETDLLYENYEYTGEKQLFGDYMQMSNSKIEQYAMCPFAYFCKYVMRINEMPSAEASSRTTGNFIHSFLERFVPRAFGEGKKLSEDELKAITEETIAQCESELGEVLKDPKTSLTLRGIRNNIYLIVESLVNEFNTTRFTPEFFELSIGQDGVSPLKFSLSDGSKVAVAGKVDRVDLYKEDGETYVRVIDYKTGSKTFSRDDLGYGINMQMLLYLESICRESDGEFLKKLGIDLDKRPIPAGVLYFSTKMPPSVVMKDNDNDDSEYQSFVKKLKRIGLVANENTVIKAMDESGGGIYSPIKLTAKGAVDSRTQKHLVDSFDEIFDEINGKIVEISEDIRAGKAVATPLKAKSHDACEYCAMSPICRRKAYCENMLSEDEQGSSDED